MQTNYKLYEEIFVLKRNTWNYLSMNKKWAQPRLEMLSTKCVYKS